MPSVRRSVSALWNSPTFTTWGNYAAQTLRLIVVTPLILTSFNATEIAAWYLFSSLAFLGVILSAQIGQTFTRMIAFAMGGADDLRPIKTLGKRPTSGEPNWPLIERAYGTIGAINAALVAVLALVTAAVGWYALENSLRDYPDPFEIWAALGVMIVTQALVFLFEQNTVALRGMNYVALSNRWAIVFSLCSIAAGFVALQAGGGILQVVLAMQFFVLLAIPRNLWLVRSVEEGRFRRFRPYGFDRSVFRWAWEPSWKGASIQLTTTGLTSLAAIFVTRHFPVATAASLLFTLRMLQSVRSIADTPFISNGPHMSRLLSQGDTPRLKTLVTRKINLAQALFGVALLMLFAAPALLQWIGSNIAMPETRVLLSLFGLALLQNQIFLTTQITSIGNNIICVGRGIMAFAVSVALIAYFSRSGNLFGVVLAIFVPRILLINIVPAIKAAAILRLPAWDLVRDTNRASSLFVVVLLCLAAGRATGWLPA